jgi:hypothetical protein
LLGPTSSKSAHVGLSAPTNSSFFDLRQPLICFSRAIASSTNYSILPGERAASASRMFGNAILQVVGDAYVDNVALHVCEDVDEVGVHAAA